MGGSVSNITFAASGWSDKSTAVSSKTQDPGCELEEVESSNPLSASRFEPRETDAQLLWRDATGTVCDVLTSNTWLCLCWLRGGSRSVGVMTVAATAAIETKRGEAMNNRPTSHTGRPSVLSVAQLVLSLCALVATSFAATLWNPIDGRIHQSRRRCGMGHDYAPPSPNGTLPRRQRVSSCNVCRRRYRFLWRAGLTSAGRSLPRNKSSSHRLTCPAHGPV